MGASTDNESSTSSTSNQYDQRKVQGQGAVEVGTFGTFTSDSGNTYDSSRQSFTDNSDRSFVADSSQRNISTSVQDSSQRNRTTNSTSYYTGTDGGSVQIAKLNSELLGSVSQSQGDTVKTIGKFGFDSLTAASRAATDLYANSSTGAGAAFGHAVDKSSELIDKLMTTAQNTTLGAQTVARDAMKSYQPPAAQNASTMRYALIAAAAVAVLVVLKK